MTDGTMPPVVVLGVHAVELAHALSKISFYRFHQQMVVVAHLTKAMNKEIVTCADVPEYLEPGKTVSIVLIDRIATIAARGDMVESARKLDS